MPFPAILLSPPAIAEVHSMEVSPPNPSDRYLPTANGEPSSDPALSHGASGAYKRLGKAKGLRLEETSDLQTPRQAAAPWERAAMQTANYSHDAASLGPAPIFARPPSSPSLTLRSEVTNPALQGVRQTSGFQPRPSRVSFAPFAFELGTQAIAKERSPLPELHPEFLPLALESPESAAALPVRIAIAARDGTTRTLMLTASLAQVPESSEPELVEVSADRQEYDRERGVAIAIGDVVVRFSRGVLSADRVEVNLNTRMAIATGNVALRRGEQVLRGARFEYSFVRDSGEIVEASGEVFQPTAGQDFNPTLPTDTSAVTVPQRPLSDRIIASQPLQGIQRDSAFEVVVGGGRESSALPANLGGGGINRLRFQAERIEFDSEGWQGRNVRLTNDPFSPPELELRADTARVRQLDPQRDEITTTNSRVVFDQNTSIPIFQDRIVIDRRQRSPSPINIGFDEDERGGLFVERSFELLETTRFRWQVTPQYFLQRATFGDGDVIGGDVFGATTALNWQLNPRTAIAADAELTSLDVNENLDNEIRAGVRAQRQLGNPSRPHILSLEYNYRDRLFNGSLGFQTVRRSVGAVVTSPGLALGRSGIRWSYQGSVQFVNAETDRLELRARGDGDRVSLTRYQGATSLGWGTFLWQGETLPATPEAGLRYTAFPVRPYLRLTAGVTGVLSVYSSDDTQASLSGSVGLQGQVGRFSRRWFDYTGFNLRYTSVAGSGESPYDFDRLVDRNRVSLGIVQQIFGPFRAGLQTSFDIDDGDAISTEYSLEYSRRTYNLMVRYNPTLEIGSIGFRLNGFNWRGGAGPLEANAIEPVTEGVTR